MEVDTDASIKSAQMKQLSEKMAQMEGLVTGLQDGLATATANISVLTADNVVLKADSAALKATNKGFVRHTNYKYTLNIHEPSGTSFWDAAPKMHITVAFARGVCGRCGNAIF